MCLAIPAQIVHIDGDGLATVDILGVTRSISIDLTPQAHENDFVLVHAGFAIEVVDADFAQETIDLIKEFPELAGENLALTEQPDKQEEQPEKQEKLPDEQTGQAAQTDQTKQTEPTGHKTATSEQAGGAL